MQDLTSASNKIDKHAKNDTSCKLGHELYRIVRLCFCHALTTLQKQQLYLQGMQMN